MILIYWEVRQVCEVRAELVIIINHQGVLLHNLHTQRGGCHPSDFTSMTYVWGRSMGMYSACRNICRLCFIDEYANKLEL